MIFVTSIGVASDLSNSVCRTGMAEAPDFGRVAKVIFASQVTPELFEVCAFTTASPFSTDRTSASTLTRSPGLFGRRNLTFSTTRI